jgi:hypothetical protein
VTIARAALSGSVFPVKRSGSGERASTVPSRSSVSSEAPRGSRAREAKSLSQVRSSPVPTTACNRPASS